MKVMANRATTILTNILATDPKKPATAEVLINSKRVDVKVMPPWNFDISEYIQPGENVVEVIVYNTLSNHHSTIPTQYRGNPESGLLGPVKIITQSRITLR